VFLLNILDIVRKREHNTVMDSRLARIELEEQIMKTIAPTSAAAIELWKRARETEMTEEEVQKEIDALNKKRRGICWRFDEATVGALAAAKLRRLMKK